MKNHKIEGEIGIAMRYSWAFCPALFIDYGKPVRGLIIGEKKNNFIYWKSSKSPNYRGDKSFKLK